MNLLRTTIVCLFCSTLAPLVFAGEDRPDTSTSNWPRFRGPDGFGNSADKTAPVEWAGDDVAWIKKLPASGHSSPVIWGDRIFLTGTSGNRSNPTRHVFCIDRRSQRILWDHKIQGGPGEKLHEMNSWATPSCATDGKVVVAFFGPAGLHCLNFDDGRPKWNLDLGSFPGSWGVGASPVIVNDMVIQNCDAVGNSFLIAVNRETGKEIWKTKRRDKPRGGWSTPVLVESKTQTELVLNGEFGVQAYEPKTGKELWFCKAFNGRGSPCPVFANGLLYVVNGKAGDVYAVKPGGKGDVTQSHMAWHAPRGGGRDLPSPGLVDDTVVVIGMKGIATGYNAQNGKVLWKERLGGNYSASPVVIGNRLYALAENGVVTVLESKDKAARVVAKNRIESPVGEAFRSSMAVSDGQIFLRSNSRLYCIGKRSESIGNQAAE